MTRKMLDRLKDSTQRKLKLIDETINNFAVKHNLNEEQLDYLFDFTYNWEGAEKIPDYMYDKILGQKDLFDN